MASFSSLVCLLGAFLSLVSAQMQFTQPDGSKADMSQTFIVGETVTLRWQAGWKGYGEAPPFVDLFLVSFNSDAYIDLIYANISLAQANLYNWRVNVPEASVTAEKNFAFKMVTARNPPNYLDAQPGKVMSPSRGFKLALSAGTSSLTSTRTLVASSSSSIASPSASAAATSTSAASSTPSPSPTSAASNTDTNNTDNKKSSTPVGAIVGGVIGGLAVIAIGVVVWLLLRMMKRKKAENAGFNGGAPGYMPSEMGDGQKPPEMYPTSPAPKYHQYVQELPANHMPVEADNNYQGRLAK